MPRKKKGKDHVHRGQRTSASRQHKFSRAKKYESSWYES